MFTYIKDIWDNIVSVLTFITPIDILDMVFLSVIMYFIIKLVRETRAVQLIKGIILLIAVLFVLNQLGFKAMGIIYEAFLNIGLIALIIMFQPELRRVLEKVGRTKMRKTIFENSTTDNDSKYYIAIDEICKACERLSATKTGALIVMEQQTKLGEQIDTGTILNATPSEALFGNIFFPNTPLHDGAVIIRDGMILAAACFLPKPLKEDFIAKELGSRHRAAIGVSEVSDAVVIVVSEETGTISVAENGMITRNFDKNSLRKLLVQRFIRARSEEKVKKPHTPKISRKGGGK